MTRFAVDVDDQGRRTLTVDGHDLSRACTSVKLDMRPGVLTEVTIGLAVDDTRIFDLGEVQVPDETREALLALGWTPPGQPPVRDINTPAVRLQISALVMPWLQDRGVQEGHKLCGELFALLDRASAGHLAGEDE